MNAPPNNTGNPVAIVLFCMVAVLGFVVLAVIGVAIGYGYWLRNMVYDDFTYSGGMAASIELQVRCDADGNLEIASQPVTFDEFRTRVEQASSEVTVNVYIDSDCAYQKVHALEKYCRDSVYVWDYNFYPLEDDQPIPAIPPSGGQMPVELTVRVHADGSIGLGDEKITFDELKSRINLSAKSTVLNAYVDPKCPYRFVQEMEQFYYSSNWMDDYYVEPLAADQPLPAISAYQRAMGAEAYPVAE